MGMENPVSQDIYVNTAMLYLAASEENLSVFSSGSLVRVALVRSQVNARSAEIGWH
jgi:hypothetical protein